MTLTAILSAGLFSALVTTPTAITPEMTLPDYAYEAAAEVGLAVGVTPFCQDITAREDAVSARLFGLWERLVSDGYDVAAVQAHLESDTGNRRIEAWLRDFQARHGAADTNLSDNCVAMRAEAGENPSLSSLLNLN
jgi:hypothetical protein